MSVRPCLFMLGECRAGERCSPRAPRFAWAYLGRELGVQRRADAGLRAAEMVRLPGGDGRVAGEGLGEGCRSGACYVGECGGVGLDASPSWRMAAVPKVARAADHGHRRWWW